MKSILVLVAVVVLAGCTGGGDDELPGPQSRPLASLVDFAREPTDSTWRKVPFADEVALGLGDSVRERRSPRELRDPTAWSLNIDLFRGYAGAGSALELIAKEDGPLRRGFGPHRHCAAAPVPPPPEATGLTRLWVQPREPDGCLDWWTVDVFVDGDGQIRVVTLDLWEP